MVVGLEGWKRFLAKWLGLLLLLLLVLGKTVMGVPGMRMGVALVMGVRDRYRVLVCGRGDVLDSFSVKMLLGVIWFGLVLLLLWHGSDTHSGVPEAIEDVCTAGHALWFGNGLQHRGDKAGKYIVNFGKEKREEARIAIAEGREKREELS